MDQDEQHLRLLSIFHYIVGGVIALFSCIFFIHLFIGIAMLTGAIEDAPAFIGLIFVAIAIFFILLEWATAACIIIAGNNLAKRKHYIFCLVTAAISCTFSPLGTILGIFTIVVLMRPSVKELFAANKTT